MPPVGLCAQVACVWEATARKPGNVHRFADFEDVTYLDFILSAVAVAPVLEGAGARRVGETVLEAVRATRRVVSTNTNLGILLLLAPLAAVPAGEDLRSGVPRVLDRLDVEDSRAVYEAIRLANPGGLGQVPDQDVRGAPTLALRQVMALAADRDLVARQYANGFQAVFGDGLFALEAGFREHRSVEGAIIACHLHLMARHPDSLIARKCGRAEAEEAARRAAAALRGGSSAIAELDFWLRAKGRRRNPGTTADLVTACLFAALRQGTIQLPPQYPWSSGPDHG